MAGPDDKSSISEFGDELKKALNVPQGISEAIEEMTKYATQLNNQFGQSRQRVVELMQVVADAVPGVSRLGGGVADVAATLEQVSSATKRNVAASAEDVSKLFASYKVTGQYVETLVNSFANVGINFSQIGKQVEQSVNTISNLGLNVKDVYQVVSNNMDQMNRYQFEGGVQGLTKMAAQASMLRFDMNETFRLADKVLTPEGAIQTAAAFQRLGVAAGDLVDPFQLMNQSINDPSGLQTSLANVTKQFTEYDEKTKTFKINPQGVLTLKEMADETSMNVNELKKMGLAAAELDMKLSQINPQLTFSNPDDRTLLANIATMDSSTGQFKVNYTDETGKTEAIELNRLTEEQTKRLIEQQKNAPKTIEDTARAQLNVSQLVAADVKTIRDSITYGTASVDQGRVGLETVRKYATDLTGAISSQFSDVKGVRETLTAAVNNVMSAISSGDDKKRNEGIENLKKQFADYGPMVNEKIDKAFDGFAKSAMNTQFKLQDQINKVLIPKDLRDKYKEVKSTVELVGQANVNVDFTSSTNAFGGLSRNQMEELLQKKEFQDAITKIVHQKWPEMFKTKQG